MRHAITFGSLKNGTQLGIPQRLRRQQQGVRQIVKRPAQIDTQAIERLAHCSPQRLLIIGVAKATAPNIVHHQPHEHWWPRRSPHRAVGFSDQVINRRWINLRDEARAPLNLLELV